jgi:DNA-binding MarR family transcriptional regulator
MNTQQDIAIDPAARSVSDGPVATRGEAAWGRDADGIPKPPPVAPAQLAAWRAFLEAHARTIDVLSRELREAEDLPLTWYDVLVQLNEADERRLRMQELANAVLLSKSGLTRLIDRMERDGLVRREACPSDRRGTFAELTAAGHRRLREAAPAHLRGVNEHFAELFDEEEAATLERLLRRVGAAHRQD